MIWNKPKKFIKVILTALTILFTIITLMALITFYIWNYKPEFVNKLDNKLLFNYMKSYNEPFTKALQLKQQGHSEESLKEFDALFLRMKNFGKIDRLYEMKRKVLKNIIHLSIKLEKFNRAKEITEYWVASDDRDIEAKRIQIDFLIKSNNIELADKKYSILFEKFKGVKSIATEYINFLVLHNKYSKALMIQDVYNKNKIAVSGSKQLMSNAKFKIFHTENNKEIFSEKKSLLINKYDLDNTLCSIQKNVYLKNVKKLRFDIDRVQNFYIYDLNIVLTNHLDNKFKAKVIKKSLNDLVYKEGKYIAKGKDPYFQIEIPYEMKDDIITDFTISFNIEESEDKNLLLDVLESIKWKLFYSYNDNFTERSSVKLNLNNITKNKIFFTEKTLPSKNIIKKMRIDLPSKIGLKIKKIEIKVIDINDTINNFSLDTKTKDIYLNGINKTEKHFKIISNDPYMTFSLTEGLLVKKVLMQVEF